jgi:hypothetical protein
MRKQRVIQPFVSCCVLLFLFTLPSAAFAEMALVPQTGQTLCYDAVGAEIPCAGTGQDGDQQMGVPWPNPRFTDNNNGTITDNLTGLIWLKNANCFGQKLWTAALLSANNLASGACSLTDASSAGDWRLPNKNELYSLLNHQLANTKTWLTEAGFSNVQDWYWSSSTYAYAYNGDYAWFVDMKVGFVSNNIKTVALYIWPVRAGQ